MIKIKKDVIREQKNFWNHCLFHPTDAIEDPWGKLLLDKMADDGAIKTVRLYAMLEDIVYMDENGCLKYDFRLNDLRLDYLLSIGLKPVISYSAMPDCIARCVDNKSSVSNKKTRYKGKLFNTSPPKDYALWEEICYEYTSHIVERYGIDEVSGWRCHCYNEPDASGFFMSELSPDNYTDRLREYCKLYTAFAKALRRVSDKIKIGGPALSGNADFLRGFLTYIRDNNIPIDYISFHNYGTSPYWLKRGTRISVTNSLAKYKTHLDIIKECGFEDKESICDEWGASSWGFINIEDCPQLIFRETEIFSAYYAKLIRGLIDIDPELSRLMICLSGQHEMTADFTGFRNFFTLHYIKKPIYNAHIMASKLHSRLLAENHSNENLSVIPTINENGEIAVLISYSSEFFKEDIDEICEDITFDFDLRGRATTVYTIDKSSTNPYRLAQRLGLCSPDPAPVYVGGYSAASDDKLKHLAQQTAIKTENTSDAKIQINVTPTKTDEPSDLSLTLKGVLSREQIAILRNESNMKPHFTQNASEPLKLHLTPNSTVLIIIS